jgi:hypothetical protein
MGLRPIVLSLCDRTGNMVQPWLEADYECWVLDIQHESGEHRDGNLMRVGADILTWLPPRREYAIAFAFPPCTNLSVSGARWFKDKGLAGLAEGIALVERCALICQWAEAPWMLENPVSVLSSYWRKPDHRFQPWQYGDPYTKKTCLWTGNGFAMPAPQLTVMPEGTEQKIWKMGPSPDRGDLRSETPMGFARAVYDANAPREASRCVA